MVKQLKSKRATTALLLPRLRRDQWTIATHPAPVKYVCMGRRWGKTVMAGAITLAAAATGNSVAWIAPTYKNTRPLWRFAEAAAMPLSNSGLAEVSRADREIRFEGRGWLGMYSADNISSILGNAFDLVVIDEAARVAEEAWYESIMPTLADRDGQALLITTPKGRNWYWKAWTRARQDGKYEAAFTAPSTDNPIPGIKRAVELARNLQPDRTYRQEWLAEFVEDGGVFRYVRECAIVTPTSEPVAGHNYVFGVDWGRENDFTVVVVLDTTARQVVYMDRFTGIDYRTQLQRIAALAERFKPFDVYAERNSMGGPLVEELANSNLPVYQFDTNNSSKRAIIDSLTLAFERRAIGIPNDEVLIGELESYESSQTDTGLVRFGAPDGMHDDCVMALAMAWQGTGGGLFA